MGSEQVMGVVDGCPFVAEIVTLASSCDKRWSSQWFFLTMYEVTVSTFIAVDGGLGGSCGSIL